MTGSTQAQINQVENLLRSFGEARATPEGGDDAQRGGNFNSRPIVAAFLAFLVFAPGCAAAAVFLLRADGNIPQIAAPGSNPPFVAKSDRLPLGQWSAEATENAGAKDEARLAVVSALADPTFLDPILIRGSIEDGTITTFADSPTAPNAFASMDKPSTDGALVEKPRPKRITSRVKLPKIVVAAALPVEPPQPSFFEKLFGPRIN